VRACFSCVASWNRSCLGERPGRAVGKRFTCFLSLRTDTKMLSGLVGEYLVSRILETRHAEPKSRPLILTPHGMTPGFGGHVEHENLRPTNPTCKQGSNLCTAQEVETSYRRAALNPNELRSILSLLSMVSKEAAMQPLLKKLRGRGELWVPSLSGVGLIPLHSAVHAHTCTRLLLQRCFTRSILALLLCLCRALSVPTPAPACCKACSPAPSYVSSFPNLRSVSLG